MTSITLEYRSYSFSDKFGTLVSALWRHSRNSGMLALLLILKVEMGIDCVIRFQAWQVPMKINKINAMELDP